MYLLDFVMPAAVREKENDSLAQEGAGTFKGTS
jgi:hypothetical protein